MTAQTTARRHQLGQVPIEEYFDLETDDMGATLAAIRYKIVAVFLRATDPATGRSTGRDNCIAGVNDKLGDLVTYVVNRINLRREFGLRELQYGLRDLSEVQKASLSRRDREKIAEKVQAELVRMILLTMRNDEHSLYYCDTLWCFSHDLRIEHDHAERVKRVKENTYHGDKRNWHGKPAKQGRRRTKQLRMAPGSSIGSTS
ncbi:MAG: hypothetical protein JWM52_256 [Candidatus Saccharibacteria bacterium]|nr:hypothetical protein [Candidatus Saccharibacteria bacterium]